ncbi:hypothetical protein BC828DRAFT_416301 [Blastocladiella britannica]|nr:hypothetical protein BC828DRAFT_416301 [Blastocladiella britannica]
MAEPNLLGLFDPFSADGSDLNGDESTTAASTPASRDAVLVVVDANTSMMRTNLLPVILRAIADHALRSAVLCPDDLFGLTLYNAIPAQNQNQDSDNDGWTDLLPLHQSHPDALRALWELGQEKADPTLIFAPRDPLDPCDISLVLSHALRAFREIKATLGGRRLIWITNQASPLSTTLDPEIRKRTEDAIRTRIDDLGAAGIQFSPYFLPDPDSTLPLDLTQFWAAALQLGKMHASWSSSMSSLSAPTLAAATAAITGSPAESPFAPAVEAAAVAGGWRLEHPVRATVLSRMLARREAKQRALFRLPFAVTPGLTMGVRGVLVYSPAAKPSPATVLAATHARLARVPETICPQTAVSLPPAAIAYAAAVGHGDAVVLDRALLAAAARAQYGAVGLRLLGFRKREWLRHEWNVAHSTLLLPDDSIYAGSVTLMAALLDQMDAQGKIAIATYYPRAGSIPRIVALLPQWEERDERETMTVPSGLAVIPLPFRDELRSTPWPVVPKMPELVPPVGDAADGDGMQVDPSRAANGNTNAGGRGAGAVHVISDSDTDDEGPSVANPKTTAVAPLRVPAVQVPDDDSDTDDEAPPPPTAVPERQPPIRTLGAGLEQPDPALTAASAAARTIQEDAWIAQTRHTIDLLTPVIEAYPKVPLLPSEYVDTSHFVRPDVSAFVRALHRKALDVDELPVDGDLGVGGGGYDPDDQRWGGMRIEPTAWIQAGMPDRIATFLAQAPGVSASVSGTRVGKGSAGTSSSRGTKIEGELDVATMLAMYAARGESAVQGLTVPQIKDFLRAVGLKVSGAKAILVGRVVEYLQSAPLPAAEAAALSRE